MIGKPGKKLSVLVMDDQEETRELLVQALSENGAQVTTVSSGVEALAFLSDGKSKFIATVIQISVENNESSSLQYQNF